MFAIEGLKVLEIIARVSLIYIGCFVLLRVSGRREMSQLGPMDLLTMLLLSEAVSPAITGGEQSITAGLIAAAVLIALAVLTSWLAMRSRRLDSLLEGDAKTLIRDGHVNQALLREQRITDEDLRAALHAHGVMNVKDIARAFVEADGQITMIKRSDLEESRDRFHA
jgi:uncharacterized membrane protein YcaP (DUF421 family)